jgi:4-amino-4-deoxy-L-arabinose transferase-like glycosyltransferase
MRSVLLFIELLRSKSVAVFWAATLAQAALWWLVPSLLYSAPPDGLALTLAVGHEFRLGSALGPPLAFWIAEVVYTASGLVGVYLVAQICVVAASWAVFTLGRTILGERHAALAALLMTGVFALTMPTADFGPSVFALPFWALALLHYWRAVGQGRGRYWLALGLDLGLLMLTSYAGLILIGLLLAFTLLTARGRAALMSVEPWIGGIIVVALIFPHLTWLDQNGGIALAGLGQIQQSFEVWLMLGATLLAGHIGLLVLIAVGASAAPDGAPDLKRAPIDAEARRFVTVFALAPVIGSVALALTASGARSYVGAPLVLLSGLAAVAMAPDVIRIAQQRLAAYAWAAVLLLPPFGVAAAILLMPFIVPIELDVAQPAAEIGRFFGDGFARRGGQPLSIVTGDVRLASLIALKAPSRPSLFLDAVPEATPWVTAERIAQRGVLVVWPATPLRLPPPAAIREHIPGLAAEPPQSFARRGRLPPLWVGWALVAPRALAAIEP